MEELSYRLRRLRTFLWESPEPATRTLIAINAFTFLSYFIARYFLGAGNPWQGLIFSTHVPWQRPWTFLTYPLFTLDPLSLIFSGYWLWIVGGALERSWSTRVFGKLFAGVTLATSVGLWVGSALLGLLGLEHSWAYLSGLWMPLAALTVAWCLLNPEQIVLLGFVLPVRGRHLMWATVALTYFLFAMGFGAPWLALFALGGIGVSYVYTRRRLERLSRLFYGRREPRPPTALERVLDWLLFHWERLRNRWGRRR